MPEAPPHTQPEHMERIAGDDAGPFWTTVRRHRMAWALGVLLLLVLMVVVPPLVSINRYQRRVASAISGSLGRPVRFDTLTLHLLPLPGITIENFVVGESPDFGAEPVMRAQTVEARLRVSSLWRRRIEVSHISLDSPSINLVRRRSDGAWNLQSILMQASQMNSAPTAQTKAGPAPRFPYIEATDARLNVKSDNDKLPFSFKETQLALWLPEPNEWHLRLSGKPVRTDTDVSDVGLVRVDATLGRAADLAAAPIALIATWKPTPLGEAGKLTAGHDLGWRGAASAEATLKGTLGAAKLSTDLHLLALRRADFVPEHTAEVNAHCEATTGGLLRSLTDLRCAIPTNTDTSMFSIVDSLRKLPEVSGGSDMPEGSVKPGVILIRGQVPDMLNWSNSDLDISLQDASPNYALAWLRLFSQRIPRELSVGGTLSLVASRSPLHDGNNDWTVTADCSCELPGGTKAAQQGAASDGTTNWLIGIRLTTEARLPDDSAIVRVFPAPPLPEVPAKRADEASKPVDASGLWNTVPPPYPVSGQVSHRGYALTYGSRSLAAFAASLLPPLGDSMPAGDEPVGPLEANRAWNGAQTWTATPAVAAHKTVHHRRAR